MNFLNPSLPRLRDLPICLAIDGSLGYLYSKLCQVDPVWTTVLFTARALAQTIFYQLANLVFRGQGLRSHKIFVVTSLVVNTTFIVALRELNLIGRLFSCLLSLALIGHMIFRIRYIYREREAL